MTLIGGRRGMWCRVISLISERMCGLVKMVTYLGSEALRTGRLSDSGQGWRQKIVCTLLDTVY